MNRSLRWIAAVLAVLLIARMGSAELFFEPSSETLTDPLVRPRPITIVPAVAVSRLTTEIAKILEKQGFSMENYDPKVSFFQAKRLDSRGNFDRVLVWAERDFEKPNDFLQIYLMYGRYELIAMSKERSYRIKVDEQSEERRIGSLRRDLINLPKLLKESP